VPDGWQVPLTQVSVGPHLTRHIPSMQSSQLFGSHRLWQAPFTQIWQGPHVSVQPWAVQVWQTGSQNGLQTPDWQLRHWVRSQASVQIPPTQVSHAAQVLVHAPPIPHVRQRPLSHVLWQTPEEQAWHWPGSQGPQVPFTHAWQGPQRVWQVPLTQSSQAPHRLRHAPPMQAWQRPASQSVTWSSMMPSQSSSTPLHTSAGSAEKGLWTL